MAKVIIPVGLGTEDVKQNTKSVKDMLNSLGGTSKETGNQLEKAFSKSSAKSAKLITDLQKANAEVKKQAQAVADLKSRLEELQTGKATVKTPETSALTKELNETEKAAEKVAQQMDKLSAEADRMRQSSITIEGTTTVADPQKYAEVTSELDSLGEKYQSLNTKADETRIKLQEATGAATQAEIQKTNTKIEETTAKLDSAKANAAKAGEALKSGSEKSSSALDKFNNRIAGLAKRVFIFSVITKALRALKNLFTQSAQGSDTFKNATAGLQQSLWAIYSVIYQYIMPVVNKVAQLISRLVQNAVTLLSKMLGKSTSELLANGQALKKQTKGLKETEKAAKKAAGGVAAFDEVNQIDGGDDTGESGDVSETGGISFDAKPLADEVNNVLDAILLVVGGAFFVIGLLLVCTGTAIPMGIGLMIAGIGILAAEIASIDWDNMPEKTKTVLTAIAAIAGLFLLALGCILLAVPGHTGLAVGCIIGGVALLVAAVALNWDSISEKLQGTFGVIMAIIGGALLVLGIILLFVPSALPIALALIVAGAGSLVAVVVANKDAIVGWIKDIWKSIKDFWNKYIAQIFTSKFWKNLFSKIGDGIKAGAKAAINGLIWLVNKAIDGLNAILIPIRGIVYGVMKAFGSDVKFGDIKIPHIPKLAKGGVVYQPTVAEIGEYSGARSNPEIVSPENKLREIYSEQQQPVVELLQELIEVEKQGRTLVANDRELARTVNKANSQMGTAIVKGGYQFGY